MKGDFTRNTFDPRNQFSRVLMQQGRVQLDADWNEQASILLHYLQTLAADLIGSHGGPAKPDGSAGDGFAIVEGSPAKHNFGIAQGRYYVDGILCENLTGSQFAEQADYPYQKPEAGSYLAYLDVWERHLSFVEQEHPDGKWVGIREAALNGSDTATRARIVWQVKLWPNTTEMSVDTWNNLVETSQPGKRGSLKARANRPIISDLVDHCVTPAHARYRGAENQLYRVEIHRGGQALPENGATFKWSRENGSVIFPIVAGNGAQVQLQSLGLDARLSLQVGDWVEVVDDDYTLQNRAEPLLQVTEIDPDRDNEVTLSGSITITYNAAKHPYLRRWDQRDTEFSEPDRWGLAITEGVGEDAWIELEDGVEVQFQPGATYRSGDYWLIPARTATGDVEWPGLPDGPEALTPHGIDHHYAPLWLITFNNSGEPTLGADQRRFFKPVIKIP